MQFKSAKWNPTLACALLLVLLLSVLQARNSLALPAFARRDAAKCQMCHFRLPELNEDGHAYIRRGLREERGGMGTGMDMGKGNGDMAKPPVASTTRDLGEPLPLEWANYFTVMGHHMIEARRHAKLGFRSGVVDAWVGGPLDPRWSGIANLAFNTESGGVDVEQAYGQFNSSWNPRFVSVRFGQILPMAILFNGGGAAMPLSAPVMLEAPSSAENPWAPATLVRGVELGVVNLPHWNAYVGVGQPQLEGLGGNSHTDLYASAECVLSEQGNAISAFGYRGEILSSPGQVSIDYERVAVFANVYAPRTKGVLGLLWGRDRPAGDPTLINKGGFLLGEFLVADQWAAYGRYDYARRELPLSVDESTNGPTLGVSFWAQTQVRLTLESQFLKNTGSARDRSAMAEIMWAF